MLRFIIRRRWRDAESQASGECFYTVDDDLKQLEEDLRRSGHGPNGYENHQVVGVEILNHFGKTASEEVASWPAWKIKAAKAAFMEPKNE